MDASTVLMSEWAPQPLPKMTIRGFLRPVHPRVCTHTTHTHTHTHKVTTRGFLHHVQPLTHTPTPHFHPSPLAPKPPSHAGRSPIRAPRSRPSPLRRHPPSRTEATLTRKVRGWGRKSTWAEGLDGHIGSCGREGLADERVRLPRPGRRGPGDHVVYAVQHSAYTHIALRGGWEAWQTQHRVRRGSGWLGRNDQAEEGLAREVQAGIDGMIGQKKGGARAALGTLASQVHERWHAPYRLGWHMFGEKMVTPSVELMYGLLRLLPGRRGVGV